MNKNPNESGLCGIPRLATRWDVSRDLVRKLINDGDLKTVTIGSRRLIPFAEVERAELVGVAQRKKRGPKKKAEVALPASN